MANKFVNYTGVQYLWKQIAGTFVKKDGNKVLSTNDFTDDLETKLNGIEAGAQVNKIETIKVGESSYPGSTENKTVDITAGVTAIAKAEVAAAGHASYEIVDAIPSAETAKDNVMYLVKNGDKHDIYVRVKNGENYKMLLIDDTDADLSGYAKTADIARDYLTKTDASSTYLTKTDASSTYLTQDDALNNYLTQSDATATYLTQSDAAATYLTQTNAESTYAKKTDLATELSNPDILAAIKAADPSYTEVVA